MNNINKLKILIVGLTTVLQFSSSNETVIRKGIVRNNVSETNISILQSDTSESM
jgi:hypothetical protein